MLHYGTGDQAEYRASDKGFHAKEEEKCKEHFSRGHKTKLLLPEATGMWEKAEKSGD